MPVLEGLVGREMQFRVAVAKRVAELPKLRGFLDQLNVIFAEAVAATPE